MACLTQEVESKTDEVGWCWLQFEADKESEKAAAYARLLWDTALLESGFEIEAPKEFNSRVYGLLAQAYNIQGDLGISAEDAAAAAAEEVRYSLQSTEKVCQSLCASALWSREYIKLFWAPRAIMHL